MPNETEDRLVTGENLGVYLDKNYPVVAFDETTGAATVGLVNKPTRDKISGGKPLSECERCEIVKICNREGNIFLLSCSTCFQPQ